VTGARRWPLWSVLMAAMATALWLASTPWLRAFQVHDGVVLLALAAALPMALSGLCARALRFPLAVSYSISAIGLVVFLLAVNGLAANPVWDGLAHVPSQLLTETLPLSGRAYLLTAPLALSWAFGTAAAELAARPVSPSGAVTAVPLAYFALAFAATTSAPVSHTTLEAALLLGATAVCALARQGLILTKGATTGASGGEGRRPSVASGTPVAAHRRRGHLLHSSSARHAGAGALAVGVVVAALAILVPQVPAVAGRPQAVARSTPVRLGTVVDPLDALASLRQASIGAVPVTMFGTQISQPWNGYVAVADLDRYDGGSWTLSATFRPTGGRVPDASGTSAHAPAGAAAAGGTLTTVQHYELERPIGLPFLPILDRAVQVSGMSVDADAATGMLAGAPTLPASYTVVSEAPTKTLTALSPALSVYSTADVPGGGSSAYALPPGSLTDVATAVRFAVNITGRPATRSLLFLQALDNELRARERRVSPREASTSPSAPALAGTSLAQVMNAVTVDRAATPEQFATFYAVVLRFLGVPARVVTGFRAPAAAAATGPLPAGSYAMTDRDAWTWVEVPVVDVGWVVADPTPQATVAAASTPPEQVTPTPTTVPKQATAVPGKGAAHAVAKPVRLQLATSLQVDWRVVLGEGIPGAIVALAVACFAVPALRRRLRRVARHQTGEPRLMAVGAWLELLDGLSRAGVQIPLSATSSEVATTVAQRFGPDLAVPARTVGSAADQAIYSRWWPIGPALAQRAWDEQRRINKGVLRSLSVADRGRALLRVGTAPARPSSGGRQ
jgi:Transglutaminase-like superfamily